jgi:site-specific DNA recombinase
MRGELAEYERAKILERTRRGMVGRIQAGHAWASGVPLGYRYISEPHGGRWEVDDDEAALVRRIFAMCVDGMATRRIAMQLTAERLPTPSERHRDHRTYKTLPAGVWGHQTVRKILTNSAYIGEAVWGKRQNVTTTTRRRRPETEWNRLAIPPILDAETFHAAQAALHTHRLLVTRDRKHDYLLNGGRLRCGRCGRGTTGICRKPGVRYYHCNSHHHVMDPGLRRPGSLRADVVEPQVWAAVVRVLEQPDLITQEVQRQEANADDQRAEVQGELTLIDAGLAKCDREAQRWADAYAAEVINLAELKGYRAEIEARRQSLLAQQATCQARLEAIGQTVAHVGALIDYCAWVRQRLQTFDTAEKRLAFEALNVRVTWPPGEPFRIEGSIPLGPIDAIPPRLG